MFTKEQITKELQRIQASIPRSYIKNVYRSKPLTPTIKKVIEIALADDSFPEEKKEKLRILEKDKMFEQSEVVENKSAVKKINAWTEKKIQEAIKEGRLPPREELNKYIYERDTNKKAESDGDAGERGNKTGGTGIDSGL